MAEHKDLVTIRYISDFPNYSFYRDLVHKLYWVYLSN